MVAAALVLAAVSIALHGVVLYFLIAFGIAMRGNAQTLHEAIAALRIPSPPAPAPPTPDAEPSFQAYPEPDPEAIAAYLDHLRMQGAGGPR